MKLYHRIATALIVGLLLATSAQAALRKPGITGATFLKVAVGARMAALGSAATTIYNDPNMIFWNPAGIQTDNGKTQIALNYDDWLLQFKHQAAAITHGFGNWGTVGLGFIYMGLSDIPADRDIVPPGYNGASMEDLGVGRYDSFDYYDLAMALAYAKQFTDRFRMGVTVKYIYEKIDTETAGSLAFDFGAVYETGFRDLAIGARINNVGEDFKFYAIGAPLPLNFSIGASVAIAQEKNSQLRLLADLTKPQDSPQLYFTGAEWLLYEKLALRGGYKFNYSGSRDEKTQVLQTDEGVSFGAGVHMMIGDCRFWFDYGYTDFHVFDATHRFSLRFEL